MFGQYLASYYSAVLNRAGEAIISMIGRSGEYFFFFFFNDPPPTEIYPLSLHDALPIYRHGTHDKRFSAQNSETMHPASDGSESRGHHRHGNGLHPSDARRPCTGRNRSGSDRGRCTTRTSEEHTSELQSP